MSYNTILADLHQELHPQQDPDPLSEDFEDEIQSLSEQLAEILARKHAFLGKVGNPNDFRLYVDRKTYWKTYRQAWKVGRGDSEF